MWRAAGLVRDQEGLEGIIAGLGDGSASPQHQAARLVCVAALLRQESRGAHYRRDRPEPTPEWLGHIVLKRGDAPWFEAVD